MRLELRDLQLLTALAQHRHFTRAAEACGISQPALSLRIANMESTLGMALVRRGARFGGFTEEGEILLGWAKRILSEHEAMLAELTVGRGEVAGHVTLGVIPTALSFAARLAAAVRAAHPRVVPVVRSASASEIAAGLAAGRFEIGISYMTEDDAGPGAMTVGVSAPRPLYAEGYLLLAPAALVADRVAAGEASLTWAQAAAIPLALLTPDMRNRQIIDGAFRQAGTRPRPVFETNDLATLNAFVASGGAATIAPAFAALGDGTAVAEGMVSLTLTEPVLTRRIAAFLPDAGFEPPAVAAVLRLAEKVAVETR
ncbi:MAG: LysR family transcriptional regulator [Pseudomonadota bacterium]